MKKRVIAGTGLLLLGGSSYLVYKGLVKVVPLQMQTKMDGPRRGTDLASKAIYHVLEKIQNGLPYASFCEITGCTFEIHTNHPDLLELGMTEHLQKGHLL